MTDATTAADGADGKDREPVLRITHVAETPWYEVKAQSYGGRRVAVWLKFLEQTPERLVSYTRYDPGVIVERHGHGSDHYIFVIAGEVLIGDRPCPAGTHVTLEHGAVFGPLIAGPEGATLYEILTGDPRPFPADPEGFERLLGERGVTPLPNPPLPWRGDRTDSDPGSLR